MIVTMMIDVAAADDDDYDEQEEEDTDDGNDHDEDDEDCDALFAPFCGDGKAKTMPQTQHFNNIAGMNSQAPQIKMVRPSWMNLATFALLCRSFAVLATRIFAGSAKLILPISARPIFALSKVFVKSMHWPAFRSRRSHSAECIFPAG